MIHKWENMHSFNNFTFQGCANTKVGHVMKQNFNNCDIY